MFTFSGYLSFKNSLTRERIGSGGCYLTCPNSGGWDLTCPNSGGISLTDCINLIINN